MTDTIEGRLRTALPDLTRAERQLVTHILRNYPVSALGSITALAQAAEPLVPQAVQAQKERFLTRWNEALGTGDGGVSAVQEAVISAARRSAEVAGPRKSGTRPD